MGGSIKALEEIDFKIASCPNTRRPRSRTIAVDGELGIRMQQNHNHIACSQALVCEYSHEQWRFAWVGFRGGSEIGCKLIIDRGERVVKNMFIHAISIALRIDIGFI
jgi:hypothetical protein